MDITETLYASTREEWRAWLSEHFEAASEVWLVSYRVHTGRPTVPYSHAVEEALCFGWIDSIRKAVDSDSYAQRYTPRREGSEFSQINKERLARLIEQEKVHPAIRERLGDVRPEAFEMPDDIEQALREDPAAWAFFQSTSPSYQRIRAAYVDHARRRPEEFDKRLRNLVRMSADEKHFGYGIEDLY